MAGERLAHQTEGAHVEGARSVGIDGGMHEPAVASEHRHEFAARGVDVAMIDRQMRRAPIVDGAGEGAMALLEKRPAEEALVRHQLPSNFGRSLATNAR